MLGGLFLMVVFGWYVILVLYLQQNSKLTFLTRSVGVNNLLAVFLQSPVKENGYGFTPNQNAECM